MAMPGFMAGNRRRVAVTLAVSQDPLDLPARRENPVVLVNRAPQVCQAIRASRLNSPVNPSLRRPANLAQQGRPDLRDRLVHREMPEHQVNRVRLDPMRHLENPDLRDRPDRLDNLEGLVPRDSLGPTLPPNLLCPDLQDQREMLVHQDHRVNPDSLAVMVRLVLPVQRVLRVRTASQDQMVIQVNRVLPDSRVAAAKRAYAPSIAPSTVASSSRMERDADSLCLRVYSS